MKKNENGLRLIRVALAGNANVGKSVIFNQLTGLHQHVGNWPGKTVEKAEGTLSFKGYTIDVVDLPGIYSLSTYSIEERISRDFIALDKPDVVVNIVDASNLERNLFFTLQLMELEPRIVIALNQIDVAKEKGLSINVEKLSTLLKVPVVPTIGVKNIGLEELITRVVEVASDEVGFSRPLKFGSEVETRVEELARVIEKAGLPYPPRWVAIKLIEGDEEIKEKVCQQLSTIQTLVERLQKEIESIHSHDAASVIASERYAQANTIANEVYEVTAAKYSLVDKIDRVTSHPVYGYFFIVLVLLSMLYSIFVFGNFVSELLDRVFQFLRASYFAAFNNLIASFLWNGLIEGMLAGTTIAIPYIIPFYFMLSILEDSGYLARIAFLTDSVMHRIGLHGKGFIPLMLGFGCNVPACLGCRIMETERERLICAFAASLIPCTARSIVIMGVVAYYMGFQWAITLYLLDFIIVFALGRAAFKLIPGEPMGMIMEMPNYRKPMLRLIAVRTWFKLKDFVFTAFPLMVIGTFMLQFADLIGLLNLIENALSPVTVWWLGLPLETGVILIFGVLRKELTLILLASIIGSSDLSLLLTPAQMFVFSFVVMVYVPCIATIAVLAREFGYRKAAIVSLSEIGFAVVLGGIIMRVLIMLNI